MAQTYSRHGHTDAAITTLERACGIYERTLGDSHGLTKKAKAMLDKLVSCRDSSNNSNGDSSGVSSSSSSNYSAVTSSIGSIRSSKKVVNYEESKCEDDENELKCELCSPLKLASPRITSGLKTCKDDMVEESTYLLR